MHGAALNALRRALPMLALAAGVAATACEEIGSAEQAAPAAETPSGSVGSIRVQLEVAGVIRLEHVSYDVTGPSFSKSAVLDVGNSTTISGSIGGIPVGKGYTLKLSASDADHPASTCQGSAPFDMPAAASVAVMVHVLCKEVRAATEPPAAVPLSPGASLALALLLLAVGTLALRRVTP